MQYILSWRQHARSLTSALLLLACTGAANGADTYNASNKQLTISSVSIGSASYSNMVVTVGGIVSGPTGVPPNASEDSYDPGNNQLTVQTVTIGSATYHNVVVTPAGLVSIAAVTGADSYNGADLSIAFVQVGTTVYDNVVISVSGIVSVKGGMPTVPADTFNSLTNQLTIPAVQVGNRVYTNVIVTPGKVMSVGGVYSTLSESVLYSFSGAGGIGGSTDGAGPWAGLIQGSDGNFYGATEGGGVDGVGTVYRITPAGVETVLYSFGASGSTDGASPNYASLIQGGNGSFYGTTNLGGAYGVGAVFEITTAGVESVLYSFSGNGGITGSTDGAYPIAGLFEASDGNIYGTTNGGGAYGEGTVFKITHAGVESVLHSFGASGTDGEKPDSGLILGSDGNFYGTTYWGGAYVAGTFFSMTTAGVESVLYSFIGNARYTTPDAADPVAGLIQGRDGNFYGTTQDGGAYYEGTVFEITAGGVETVLHSFSGNGGINGSTDGAMPEASLLQGSDGNFYGTTYIGGTYDQGTVFKITPAGVETVLYSFSGNGGVGGSTDGAQPLAGLIQDSHGNLYGTTQVGGANGSGAVFKLANVMPAK